MRETMGAQSGSERWRLAEMRRLSLVSYLMSCTFSCLSDLPRARGAARWGRGCARWRGASLAHMLAHGVVHAWVGQIL